MEGHRSKHWTSKLGYLLRVVIFGAGFFFSYYCLARMELGPATPIIAWLIAVLLQPIAVVVHEGGHYLGARWMGMPVLQIRIGAVDIRVRRKLWAMRWSPQPKGRKYGGLVVAALNLQRPLRTQMLLMVLLGPLLNLLVAALLFGVLQWPGLPPLAAPLATAFAAINLAMGVSNLLPWGGVTASDGKRLLQWLRHDRDDRPDLAFARLQARLVAGTTAEHLPEVDLAELESRPMPAPLIPLLYRLKAAQHRGAWDEAIGYADRFEALLRDAPAFAKLTKQLAAYAKTESAFCIAIHRRDASALDEATPSRELAWSEPALWPRCLALQAALAGRREESLRLLAQAMRHARNSPDRSLAKSEQMIGRYIMHIAEERLPAAVPPMPTYTTQIAS